jgi:cell division protein ZapA (FtsZ GTPase activity inhibitor)
MADYTMTDETQVNHTIQVTVLIAGRPYLLHVNAADEALIHRLAKEINDKLTAFTASQPTRDLQDSFALALLTYALDAKRAAQRNKQVPAY